MAILKRRKSQTLLTRTKESLWPTMGWLRVFQYYCHRLFRREASPYGITAGLASGIAVSFTPFLGTHVMLGVVLSWVTRGNMWAGVVGTAFGNVWTFPLIFWLTYNLGMAVCDIFTPGALLPVVVPEDVVTQSGSFLSFFTTAFSDPAKWFWPMTVGGLIYAAISWPVSYLLLYYPVCKMQQAYQTRRLPFLTRKAKAQEGGRL